MITQENEFYLRFLLLLIQGGTEVLREIAAKALQKCKTTLDQFLSKNASAIKKTRDLTKKQKDILYPASPMAVSDMRDYDITLLSYLITNFLTGSLDSNESNAVYKIRQMRNDYYAHKNEAKMNVSTFNKEWSTLMRIMFTISHNLPEEKRGNLTQIMDSIEHEQLDIKVVIDEIKRLDQSNEVLQSIQMSLDDLRQTCSTIQKELKDIKLKLESQGKNTNVVNTVHGKIVLNADKQEALDHAENADRQEALDHAEKLLLETSKHSVEKSTDENNKQLKEPVDKFIEDIEEKDIKVKQVCKGSVVFEFMCFSLSALLDLIDYFNSSRFQERLHEIAAALEDIVGTKINVSGILEIQSLQDVITNIQEKKYEQVVNFEMECTGVDGLLNALEIFEGGKAANSLNELSTALSESVGKPVTLHTSIDIEQMQRAINSIREELDRSKSENSESSETCVESESSIGLDDGTNTKCETDMNVTDKVVDTISSGRCIEYSESEDTGINPSERDGKRHTECDTIMTMADSVADTVAHISFRGDSVSSLELSSELKVESHSIHSPNYTVELISECTDGKTSQADQKHVVSIVVAACDSESASIITSKLINEDCTVEANQIWTVKRGVILQKEPQTSISRLKEYDDASMDYDDSDLSVEGNTGKKTHRFGSYESENEFYNMKNVKSSSEPGKSSDHSQAAQQILADIHIIIKPHAMSSTSSFVFPSCKAGILVVPCDSRKFDQDKEILINSVKEIGHYWKKDAFTDLVIVNMPSQERGQASENENTRNKFIFQIHSLLYGTHFDHRVVFCDSDELLKTIYEKVSECIEYYPSLTEQDVNALDVYNRKENGQFFVEASKIEPHVTNAKAILQERNIGFVQNGFYKKEEVFNAFRCFIEDFHSAEQYLELAEFYERIDSNLPELFSKSRMLLDAFCALGLTYVCPNKHVYILPLMVSRGNIDTFDKLYDFSPESNQLRITFNSDIMPVALKAKILIACLTNGWIINSFRPSISDLTDTYFARKGNFGLCLTFETSDAKCYVYLQMSRDHKTGNLEKECEKTRKMITEILGEKCQNYVSRKQDKPPFDYSDEVDWINVDDLLSSKRCLYKGGNHLLKYWFSTEEKFIVGAEVNAGTIDSFLEELAKLFGAGYYLFFVEQSIPSESIDRLRETNISIQRLVYFLLKEWWQKRELKQAASVSALRDAIVNDTSLKISIHKFDSLVDKFFND